MKHFLRLHFEDGLTCNGMLLASGCSYSKKRTRPLILILYNDGALNRGFCRTFYTAFKFIVFDPERVYISYISYEDCLRWNFFDIIRVHHKRALHSLMVSRENPESFNQQ